MPPEVGVPAAPRRAGFRTLTVAHASATRRSGRVSARLCSATPSAAPKGRRPLGAAETPAPKSHEAVSTMVSCASSHKRMARVTESASLMRRSFGDSCVTRRPTRVQKVRLLDHLAARVARVGDAEHAFDFARLKPTIDAKARSASISALPREAAARASSNRAGFASFAPPQAWAATCQRRAGRRRERGCRWAPCCGV